MSIKSRYTNTTPVNHLISPWTESIHTHFYDWDRNNNNKCSIIHEIEFSGELAIGDSTHKKIKLT